VRGLLVGLVVVFFLVSVAGALAAPPFQATNSEGGTDVLTIMYPGVDRFSLGSNVTLPFMVFNATGKAQTSSSVSCMVTFYSASEGPFRAREALVFNAGRFEVANANMSPAGYYTYGVYCNDSVRGGFVRGSYWVSAGGAQEGDVGPSGIIFLGLIPLVLGLFLLVGGVSLDNDSHPFVKIFLFLSSFVMGFVSMQFGSMAVSRFYNFPEVVDAVGQFTFWFTILWGVLVTYFVIYGVVVMVRQAAQEKDERLRY